MDEAFETMDPRGELHHQMLTALVAIDTACGSSDVGELPARSPPAGGIDAAVSAGLATGLGRAVLQHSEVGELVAASAHGPQRVGDRHDVYDLLQQRPDDRRDD